MELGSGSVRLEARTGVWLGCSSSGPQGRQDPEGVGSELWLSEPGQLFVEGGGGAVD